jgi:hypothetical protein
VKLFAGAVLGAYSQMRKKNHDYGTVSPKQAGEGNILVINVGGFSTSLQ